MDLFKTLEERRIVHWRLTERKSEQTVSGRLFVPRRTYVMMDVVGREFGVRRYQERLSSGEGVV